MSCYHPVKVWKSLILNERGNREIVFKIEKGIPESEFFIPCGQCSGCRIDRSCDWATRLMHEKKYHNKASFLTLTYNKESLPEHGVLVPDHLTKFIKNVRNEYRDVHVRFLGVGEYGDEDERPHYHLILFGVDFIEDRKPHNKNKNGDQLYTSKTAERLWGDKGYVWIGAVTQKSCGYVARYCFKKINGELSDEHYGRIDEATGEWYMLPKEFMRVSNRPGIGYQFYKDYKDGNLFLRDSVIVDGKERNIPHYYDRKLAEDDPVKMIMVRAKRVALAKLQAANNTPERLKVREEIKKAQIDRLKRSL